MALLAGVNNAQQLQAGRYQSLSLSWKPANVQDGVSETARDYGTAGSNEVHSLTIGPVHADAAREASPRSVLGAHERAVVC